MEVGKNKRGLNLNWWQEIIFVVIMAILISVFLRFFVFGMYEIPSESMRNTIQVGDTVFTSGPLINAVTDNDEYNTGDIIVFNDENGWLDGTEFEGETLVKRVIGEPGDVVSGDMAGNVYIDGVLLDEPYLPYGISPEGGLPNTANFFNFTLGPNQYWVMGDNRYFSSDSRIHGAISESSIVGKVIYQFHFPWN